MNKKELEYELKVRKIMHDWKMEEIKEKFENEKKIEMLRYGHLMEIQRIRSAEIRKSQMRKGEGGYKY